MSRKKRNNKKDAPWLVQSHKPKQKKVRIEERIDVPGLGSITRAGKLVIVESRRTPAEQEELTRRFAAAHAEVVSVIQAHVDALSDLIPAYDPLDLLHRAYNDFFLNATTIAGEHEVDFTRTIDVRMLDYTQSILVSRPPSSEPSQITDEEWTTIRNHMTELYSTLLHHWPSTYSAHLRLQPGYSTEDHEEECFRMPLLLEWISVRGSRYPTHEKERAQTLLEAHDETLYELFGVTGRQIAAALEEILDRLTKGVGEAFHTIAEIHLETFSERNTSAVAVEESASEQELMSALVDGTGRREELAQAFEKALGKTLFDITDLLPEVLLRLTSLGPGQDAEFYAPGPHMGWPVRTPPTHRRPIFASNDRFYVFNPYSIENFYRAIELAVMTADPTARQRWNERQKTATESHPIDLLTTLLPGAVVYRDVEYPFRDASGAVRWCECDIVIVLDGMLFVAEVKAGRASDRSPLEATVDHIRNVRRLLVDPAKQADRFVRYVQSQPEVVLYDDSRTEIGRLRRDDFDLTVRCAITADSLASVSSLFQHSAAATEGEAVPPTWCVSFDDLYVYRDVLRGPTRLCHFLTYRLQAFGMSELIPLDELDHLGAYLEHNAYPDWVADMKVDMLGLHGYRAKLDEYFQRRWEGDVDEYPPIQPLPPILEQTIERLEESRTLGFLRAGGALLNLDGEARDSLARMVFEARKGLSPTNPSRTVTIFREGGAPIFAGVATERGSHAAHKQMYIDHALSQLLISATVEGVLISVLITPAGEVVSAECNLLNTGSLSSDRRAQLKALAGSIAKRRFERADKSGVKIGRNNRCLCGSGRKYKKCCLRD